MTKDDAKFKNGINIMTFSGMTGHRIIFDTIKMNKIKFSRMTV